LLGCNRTINQNAPAGPSWSKFDWTQSHADPPDLIISDTDMPFLDRLELLSLLKTEERTASIPVILLSGRSDSDTLLTAGGMGVADYMSKPVTRAQLLESVEACLARAIRPVTGK
jgi:PleD family two-component response regulator